MANDNDRIHKLERLQAELSPRVGRLEAAKTPTHTVAKAANPGWQRQHDDAPTASQLLAQAQGVIDSPTQICVISSMVQGGQLQEAQKMTNPLGSPTRHLFYRRSDARRAANERDLL